MNEVTKKSIMQHACCCYSLIGSMAIQQQGAHRYDRIARFFGTCLLEVAGMALEWMIPNTGQCIGDNG